MTLTKASRILHCVVAPPAMNRYALFATVLRASAVLMPRDFLARSPAAGKAESSSKLEFESDAEKLRENLIEGLAELELLKSANGSNFEVLYYYTEYYIVGSSMDSVLTPVVLKDGRVVGFGWDALELFGLKKTFLLKSR